jgi:hypothetical protein
MISLLALELVLLHDPNGGAVYVHPDTVTTMRGAPGEKNQHFTEQAKCLLNLADGKFVAVVEDCETVRKLLREHQ